MKFTSALVLLAASASAFAPAPASVRPATSLEAYKLAVVGGGPSGACAAESLVRGVPGSEVYMFERKFDNAKPCGGAIPLCMIGEFDLPETVVDRKVRKVSRGENQ